MPEEQPDAWTSILQTLERFIVPDWSDWIGLLPLLLVLTVIGPILSLLMLGWLHHFITKRRYRVRYVDPEPVNGTFDENGTLMVGPNIPFCARHGLIYPPTATICDVDKEELAVKCPVDDAPRTARQQTCGACGTRYVLGATPSAVTVRGSGRPPAGGAAVA